MVEAKWSGKYPLLCRGQWSLKVDGKDVTDKIPVKLRQGSMNTRRNYSSWHIENSEVIFEDYIDGLEARDWINENSYWLNQIAKDYDTQKEIFEAIRQQDFRSGSCGGCI